MKRDTINGSDKKVTKRGWVSASDINKQTHRTPGAHKPDCIWLWERGKSGVCWSVTERERDSGQNYFLGRLRNLLCSVLLMDC